MVAARYINRELLAVFAVTVLVLLVVAVGGRFVGYLQDAAAGKYAAAGLLNILRLRLPGFLQLLLPFSFYIALLLTFSRLHAEREMGVLQCAGATPGHLIVWVAAPVAAVVGVTAWLSLQVTPKSNAELVGMFAEQSARNAFDALNPGRFNRFARDGRVVYAESVDDERARLGNVFISEYGPGEPLVTVWAGEGRQYLDEGTGSRFLVLRDGRRYLRTSGGRDFRITRFETLSQRMTRDERPSRRVEEDALSTLDLWKRGDTRALAELHWRLAMPIFCLAGALLAMGVARAPPRHGRFARVVPAVLLLLAYYVVLLGNQRALLSGLVPAPVGLWPGHALFCGLGAWLFIRADKSW